MEANKIDELFRSSVDGLPSTPSAESWGKLESMLQEKKRGVVFWYYGIAAGMALILCSVLIVWNYNPNVNSRDQIALNSVGDYKSFADVPVAPTFIIEVEPLESNTDLNEGIKKNASMAEVSRPSTHTSKEKLDDTDESQDEEQSLMDHLASNDDSTSDLLLDKMLIVEDSVPDLHVNTDMVAKTKTNVKKRMPITIIYKRGAKEDVLIADATTNPQDSTKENKNFFKSILDTKRDLANGELFAGIRDAKSSLFKNSKVKNSK